MNTSFYIAATISIFSTLMVITRKNTIHALLYLAISLLAVAVVFYTLGAPFISALEVIVYAGAIVVIFIFVIMMLNLGRATIEQERRWLPAGAWLLPALLSLLLFIALLYALSQSEFPEEPVRFIGPKEVGFALFGPYLLAVELTSVLLLAAAVGVYHLGRQDKAKGGVP